MTPEEYIKAYTRGHSNELVCGGYHEWLTPENAIAAVELAREEMKKDAIECEVHQTEVEGIELDSVEICSDGLMLDNKKYKVGDKVKVIIIKE